ncbi:hypothetical protein D3C81_1447670 [compost metagenome]
MQAATEGHVHFLEAAADAEQRQPGIHRGADQRQGQVVAGRIVRSARGAVRPLVVLRLDVGRRAGEQQAVEALEQVRNVDQLGRGRDDQRQAAGANGYGAQVLVAGDVEGMRADLFAAGADADQGLAGHGAPGDMVMMGSDPRLALFNLFDNCCRFAQMEVMNAPCSPHVRRACTALKWLVMPKHCATSGPIDNPQPLGLTQNRASM